MPAKLSININKYALLRNSRGMGLPDLCHAADVCIAAGCHGITVHPRIDERHITLADVPVLHRHLKENHEGIEFNIECEDAEHILKMVRELRPHQCTLVPVTPGEVTSDHGWDPVADVQRLKRAIEPLKDLGIRVSCFADCEPNTVAAFANTGTDRVELYTGPFAAAFGTSGVDEATATIFACASAAREVGIGVNAGHDLDRHNLAALTDLDNLLEVSIGHAQICRALEVGTTQSVQELLKALQW